MSCVALAKQNGIDIADTYNNLLKFLGKNTDIKKKIRRK